MPCVQGTTFARRLRRLQRMKCSLSRSLCTARLFAARVSILALPLLVPSCMGQEPAGAPATPVPSVNTTLPVNWIYGAYLPKNAPVVSLTGKERFKLYLRQTYTTPGIYVKTGFFAIHDQVKETEPEWGDGASGFAKRVGSIQAGNVIQNSLTALGNAAVGFEPRLIAAAAKVRGPEFATPSCGTSLPTGGKTTRQYDLRSCRMRQRLGPG
jgi:hypothetical protein